MKNYNSAVKGREGKEKGKMNRADDKRKIEEC